MSVLIALAQDCGDSTGCGWARGSHETNSQASEEERLGKDEAKKEGDEWASPILL